MKLNFALSTPLRLTPRKPQPFEIIPAVRPSLDYMVTGPFEREDAERLSPELRAENYQIYHVYRDFLEPASSYAILKLFITWGT